MLTRINHVERWAWTSVTNKTPAACLMKYIKDAAMFLEKNLFFLFNWKSLKCNHSSRTKGSAASKLQTCWRECRHQQQTSLRGLDGGVNKDNNSWPCCLGPLVTWNVNSRRERARAQQKCLNARRRVGDRRRWYSSAKGEFYSYFFFQSVDFW